jgi:hypothetical protein
MAFSLRLAWRSISSAQASTISMSASSVSRRVSVAYLLVTPAGAAGVLVVGLLGGPRRVVAMAVTIVGGVAVAAVVNTRYRLSSGTTRSR